MEYLRTFASNDFDNLDDGTELFTKANIARKGTELDRFNASLGEFGSEFTVATKGDHRLKLEWVEIGREVVDVALGSAPVALGNQEQYLFLSRLHHTARVTELAVLGRIPKTVFLQKRYTFWLTLKKSCKSVPRFFTHAVLARQFDLVMRNNTFF